MNKNLIKTFAMTSTLVMTLNSCHNSTNGQATLTAPLDNVDWEASKWISAADAPVVTGRVEDGTRAADGASWFICTVMNGPQKVVKAKWMTSGLGVYDLYVNGKRVGNEILKPGFTHYAKTKRSFTYDITPLINTRKDANNLLSVQVTPGWWADKIITPAGHDGMIGKKCAFRGVLELTYIDGSKEAYPTYPTDWKAGIAGPVTHAAIFDGEDYDARIAPIFEDTDKLPEAELNSEFSGEILPTDGAEI